MSGMTRSAIASAVRAVARHPHNPAARHWKAIRKIIVCLKATKDLGVVFRREGDLKLSLFAMIRTTPTNVKIGGRSRVSRPCSAIQLRVQGARRSIA